jgi:crotonobetainyl-CoA:carnitine CoA-transferase CaiB-like acyl-CoA transferase
MAGPLGGIRVVEATVFQNGPFAGALLADLGAEVIKIEPPVTGDPGRGQGLPDGRLNATAYFQAHNRTKRGIALDLKRPEAREVVYRLVETADVFLQNYRLGVAERLGIGHADLRARNPGLIYASVTGLGREGPERHLPVMDSIGLGRSGLMLLNANERGEPRYLVGAALADQTGALTMAYAILGALVHKARTGEGQELEVSQLGSVVMLQNMGILRYLLTGLSGERWDRWGVRNPLWNVYRCGDGLWMVFAMSQGDRFWPAFCAAVERPDWLAEPRYATMALREARAPELIREMDAHFASRPRAYWLGRLGAAGLLAGPVQDYAQLVADPQVRANGYLTEMPTDFGESLTVVGNPVRYAATPVVPPARAPELGQHTEEVLLELGYAWDDIAALREAGAI